MILLLLIGCKSKTVNSKPEDIISEDSITDNYKFVKVSLSEVDINQKKKAYELGKRVLMTCNTSKFKPFNSTEATASVIKNTTLENLTKICARYRQYYGEFKDLKLVEVYKKTAENVTIFRYKALYSKKIANKELRVIMNEENKVSSIKSMDWANVFK